MKKAFFTTRLSDGRKVELNRLQYFLHLNNALNKLNPRPAMITQEKGDNLVRTHLELGGHLEGKL